MLASLRPLCAGTGVELGLQGGGRLQQLRTRGPHMSPSPPAPPPTGPSELETVSKVEGRWMFSPQDTCDTCNELKLI